MKTFLASLALLVALVIGYRACASARHLDVDPHARHEIEKAKRR